MTRVLCTFSGPFGDILWSLPTVRAISQMLGQKVDFATMPEYKSLKELLAFQPYIRDTFIIPDWHCEGSPHGNQPWNPPANRVKDYDRCFHLTYRAHPGIGGKRLPLIDFIADQQGIKFIENPLPFLETRKDFGYERVMPYVAIAFNPLYNELKTKFYGEVLKAGVLLQDVSTLSWLDAATVIKYAKGFVGCRSSNNVLAHGVGQKNIFIYEPHPNRKASGQFGDVFGCPYGQESTVDASPEVAAQACIEWIRSIFPKENSLNEATETLTGGVC